MAVWQPGGFAVEGLCNLAPLGFVGQLRPIWAGRARAVHMARSGNNSLNHHDALPLSPPPAWLPTFSSMVVLTMTPSIVEGLQIWNGLSRQQQEKLRSQSDEPSLEGPAIGNPISHGQIIDLWAILRDSGKREYSLESLLRGSTVYVSPPPPKPQPVRCPARRYLFHADSPV